VLIDFAANDLQRGTFQKLMAERGIGVGHHYPSIPSLTYYRSEGYREADWPVAARVGREIVTLPLFPGMQNEDVTRVVQAVRAVLR
jgi:dTDP-4-amino-4,6-dideoxygalactose transaminase